MGFKAPRGWGLFTNPKKALYNRVYSRTSVSVDDLVKRTRDTHGPWTVFSPSSESVESAVIWLFTCAIMAGFLLWIGFSLKWALILTGLGGIGAVVGKDGLKFILGLAFAAWIFLR